MKKVLGLDLGVASIGWALVNQADNPEEKSSIIRIGVRVNPLSTDEKTAYTQGKSITTNADRRDKRSARRNLQRYQLRRSNLISLLKNQGWINDDTILAENGNKSTFETFRLRAEAVEKEISLCQLSRVLLMINKKRGYKSNRKAKGDESGNFLDGIELSKQLYEENLTPGEYSLRLMKNGIKHLPDFYPSDLKEEFNRIWEKQKNFYPEFLTDDFKKLIEGRGRLEVSKIIFARYEIYTADNKGKLQKLQSLEWRVQALKEKVEKEILAYVLADISGRINSSSGYLGNISDRSKELFMKKLTVGQYLYNNLKVNPHFSTKNLVFYRLDYLDEFEKIWETQSRFHKELTPELKNEIRDIIIFYQRRLKSQKWLINNCEFEKSRKVAPKSSIAFQEFKIWQTINNLLLTNTYTGEIRSLTLAEKQSIAYELKYKRSLSNKEVIEILIQKKQERREYELNFKEIQGNTTLCSIFEKFLEISDILNQTESDIKKLSASKVFEMVETTFKKNNFNTEALVLDTTLEKEASEKQPLFKLWHLLYSYENDSSATGDKSFIEKISSILQMPLDLARIVSTITFKEDYASLSHHAITKILPYLKQGHIYSEACQMAGYNHSEKSLTKEEIENKVLVPRLDNIAKNSLRNPVVEKILNQMINVINCISDFYGKPDEIHLEMARELKQNQKQRQKATERNNEQEKENAAIRDILKKAPFNLTYISKTDILRYKLYEELRNNGYHTLYSDKYISKEELFSRNIDIEHIIPQALMFNDSYSNKTLEFRDINQEKDKMTAFDYVEQRFGKEGLSRFEEKVNMLFREKQISKTKRDFLLMKIADIPEDFLNRDLTNSQYIAKQAKEILEKYVKIVMPTTGSITARLREDWQLVDVMKEINLPKYEKAGLAETKIDKDGRQFTSIKDWSKRDDHRHHAMDALTIAFTKPSYIQYLNNIKARTEKGSSIYGIMSKETSVIESGTKRKRIFNPPMPLNELRDVFKKELDSVLVSIKAKNKVATKNENKSKKKDGFNSRTQLTPRGQLHAEQVYGLRKRYVTTLVPVKKITLDNLDTIASAAERNAIRQRLELCKGDSKKAFSGANSLDKNPIWIDSIHSKKVGDKVKCISFETVYSIRKDINPNLTVSKVLDTKCRQILEDRLKEYGNDPKKAFVNLDQNPIWLNKEKGIQLKRVTIAETFGMVSLHKKKDHKGNLVLDNNGNTIPADYVNLKNNHHIAIYRNAEGELEESVISFYEALQRVIAGKSAVNKDYNKDKGWTFLFSMKINEMFVFPNPETGFDPSKIDLKDPENYKLVSPNLFRVQKLSSRDYWFRLHLTTNLDDTKKLQGTTWKRITSLSKLEGATKVRIDHIGNIVAVGEYD